MMCKNLDLFILCLFVTVRSRAATISPPQNVSLVWISDFNPVLSWAPPEHSGENCSYWVEKEMWKNPESHTGTSLSYGDYTVMEGGFLTFSVKAVCNGMSSEPVILNSTYPELVRDFQCSIRSSRLTNCSWLPSSHAPELRFFYRLVDEGAKACVEDNSSLPALHECSDYRHSGGVRTGCNLRDACYTQAVHVLFNGTLNKSLVRNTFKIDLLENVKPDALNWTVTKVGGEFNISWIPPDIGHLSSWTFNIRYTECNENKFHVVKGQTSTQLEFVSHCQYHMTIKAIFLEEDTTPWSEEKYFDAETDPNVLVYAAVIIPLVFIILAALACVCFRKHKEKIFPDVPEPRDLLADFSDNNNKITVGHLYTPAKEEDCEISLVIEPQLGKLNS